jgi:hypothetical protein
MWYTLFSILFLVDILYIIYSSKYKHYKTFEKNRQTVLRQTQQNQFMALKTFLVNSSSWSHLPQLPNDIQRVIYNECFDTLNVQLWCELCEIPLLKTKQNKLVMCKTYKNIDDKYYCEMCHGPCNARSKKQQNNILL